MYTKLKAFISVAIISLSLFIIPVSVLLNTGNVAEPTIVVQANVAYANTAAECGITNLLACVPPVFEVILFWPSYLLVKGAGIFFDFFMDYSISSVTYSQGVNFVTQGWAAVRDIANIFFIFVLLYIAIGTILNLSQVNTKKMLVKVILVALLINFSLFFTRVIIDASNILARSFVGSIDLNVTNPDGTPVESEYNQYSAAIVAGFHPASVLSTAEGGVWEEIYDDSSLNGMIIEITFILIISAILLVMSYAFITVGIMLLGRVIELWYLMIIAPIAFISIVLPFSIPKLGWNAWIKNLVSTAFMAPVFMFFLYLIIMFLNLGLDATIFDPSGGMWNQMLQIIIPFVIILMLVLKAKSIAEKMAGDIGAAVAKVGAAAAGLGVAALSGGTAMALRGTVGKYAANSKYLAGTTRTDGLGKLQMAAGNYLKTASMDWRQTSKGKSIMKDMGMADSAQGWSRTGGYQGFKDRYKEREEKFSKQRNENATYTEKVASEEAEANLAAFEGKFAGELESLAFAIKLARQKWQDDPDGFAKDKDGNIKTDAAGNKITLHDELRNAIQNQTKFMNGEIPDNKRVQEMMDARGFKHATMDGKPVDKGGQSWKTIDDERIDKSHALKSAEGQARIEAADAVAKQNFFTSGGQQKSQRDAVVRSIRGNSSGKQPEKQVKAKTTVVPRTKKPDTDGGDTGGGDKGGDSGGGDK